MDIKQYLEQKRQDVDRFLESIMPAEDARPATLHKAMRYSRSEEHTSELQSRLHLVCRLLLEKKKKKYDLLTWMNHEPELKITHTRHAAIDGKSVSTVEA